LNLDEQGKSYLNEKQILLVFSASK